MASLEIENHRTRCLDGALPHPPASAHGHADRVGDGQRDGSSWQSSHARGAGLFDLRR